MDGENNGKPYEQMDALGVYTTIFGKKKQIEHCMNIKCGLQPFSCLNMYETPE